MATRCNGFSSLRFSKNSPPARVQDSRFQKRILESRPRTQTLDSAEKGVTNRVLESWGPDLGFRNSCEIFNLQSWEWDSIILFSNLES